MKKTVKDSKANIERIFSAIGVRPVHRQTIEGEEVFFADGYIPPAMIDKGYLIKFEVYPAEFPFGAFMTLFWSERHKGTGSMVFFDALHDPGHTKEQKAQMRVNTAIDLAQKDLKKRKKNG